VAGVMVLAILASATACIGLTDCDGALTVVAASPTRRA